MRQRFIVTLSTALLISGCATHRLAPLQAEAVLESRSQSAVVGKAVLSEQRGGVRAHVELAGLNPGSEHGFHVHEKGDCSAADASSAGGHFNPDQTAHGAHGSPSSHTGDLPSLVADGTGRVMVDLLLENVSLSAGPKSLVGRSLVVHRDRDDFVTQPSGNSGPRVACGVIVLMATGRKHE
jgi:Cu-Zn family superoxide dismutase